MKQILTLMLIGATLLTAIPLTSHAAEPFTVINAQKLKAMIDHRETVTVVIDSRSRAEYDQAHIAGAISLPLPQMAANPGSLSFPESARLVFYCSGST